MVKIALLRLENSLDRLDHANEHLGLAYLTSTLRYAGHNVKIYDNNIDPDIDKNIIEFNPDIVGYTTNQDNMETVINFNSNIKYKNNPLRIFGGPQATFSAKKLLLNEDVDIITLGEAEKTMLELVGAYSKGNSFDNIKGIYYKNNNIKFTGYRPIFEDLDNFEFPSRDVLSKQIGRGDNLAARILTSRGCTHNCYFCQTPSMRKINPGKVYRSRSPKNVVDEIEKLHSKYGIKWFYLNDDLYIANNKNSKNRALNIANLIIKRGLPIEYRAELRSDSIGKNDTELMKTLVKSGLTRIFVGSESGSESMLKYLGKRTTVDTNIEFIEFAKSLGINVSIGRILFGPFTDWNELSDSIDFFYKTGGCSQIFRKPIIKLLAFPGTEITKQLKKEKLIDSDDFYIKKDYKFKNEKVGQFHDALRENYKTYLNCLNKFFDMRSFDKINNLEKEVNDISYEFFMNNIRLGNNWNKNDFNDYMERFLEKLKVII